MPQKRRTGSKASVVNTRMRARTHVGRTSGKEKGTLASGEGQSWRLRRWGGAEARSVPPDPALCRRGTPETHWLGVQRGGAGRPDIGEEEGIGLTSPTPMFKCWEGHRGLDSFQ